MGAPPDSTSPLLVQFEHEGDLYVGEMSEVVELQKRLKAIVETSDGMHYLIPLQDILGFNPELPGEVALLRERMTAVLEGREEIRERLLTPGQAEVLDDQTGTLLENLRTYHFCDPTGKLLGSGAGSTALGGYAHLKQGHEKRGINEDRAAVAAIEKGARLTVIDGVGGHANSHVCADKLAQNVAAHPDDLPHAIATTANEVNKKDGSAVFASAQVVKGEQLEVARMGDIRFKLYDKSGALKAWSGMNQPSAQYDLTTKEYVKNCPPKAHSATEYLELNAEELRKFFFGRLALKIKNRMQEEEDLQLSENAATYISQYLAAQQHGILFTHSDANLDALITEHKLLLEGIEAEVWDDFKGAICVELRINSSPRSQDWLTGLEACCLSIIQTGRPLLLDGNGFTRSVKKRTRSALRSGGQDFDLRRFDTIVEEGDLMVVHSDGAEIKDLDDTIKAWLNEGKGAKEICQEICRIVDQAVKDGSQTDNGSVVVYQVA